MVETMRPRGEPRNTPDPTDPANIAADIMRAHRSGPVGPDARVWHIALVDESKPLRPERLATLVLSPADVARFGERAIEAAVAASRRQWASIAIKAGYVEGWRVDVIRETGFVRSVFPGAAIAGAPSIGGS
jgi:hypothetical protein